MKISVAICCQDAETTIASALDSASWADEIVVVDSGSTDGTAGIARSRATRYLEEPWRGYTEQKRFAASRCRNDWVLILDADEECSPELADEICALDEVALAGVDVVHVRRRNYVLGRPVRAWDPDWQSRLIHRGRAVWADEALHDRREPGAPGRSLRLRERLLHGRAGSGGFRDVFDGAKLDARLPLVAAELDARGRRAGVSALVFRPLWAFFRVYVLGGAFREGRFGIVLAWKAAIGTHLKYAALWTRHHPPR